MSSRQLTDGAKPRIPAACLRFRVRFLHELRATPLLQQIRRITLRHAELRVQGKLLKEHDIDTIVLVDGGVDSLMRGDEEGCGTIFQDTISVGVVNLLDVPTKILACVGFGTETEEGVCHYRTLENIAGLTKNGGFLGACCLTANMAAFKYYEEICGKVAVETNHRAMSTVESFPPFTGSSGNTATFSIFCQTCRRSSRRWPPSIGSSTWRR